MGISVNGESSPAPVPFSYAQAAKGRVSNPASTPAPAAPIKEPTTWADDYSDTHTAIEEHQSNGPPNGAQTKQTTSAKATTNGPLADLVSAASHPSSPHYDSSATTAKEDDINSPIKAPSDSIWDRKSSSSQIGESTQEAVKDGEAGLDSSKELEGDQPGFKPMKEAPVPVVNFWQKRAQEAKAKQTPTAPAPIITQTEKPLLQSSQTAKPNSETSPPLQGKSQAHLNGAPPQPHDSAQGANNKAKGAKAGRPQKSESVLPKPTAPPPPTRDASAWPTPLTAQDEDRRKALEKEDKPDKDRPPPVTSKPHGKNEWVHVPYTPSVKFNTPLPQTRGRGGRGGGRGSRGGSLSDRGAVPSNAATAKEDVAAEPRGRADNQGRRASIQAPNGSRTTSVNAAEKHASVTGSNKRYSLQDDAVSSLNSRSNQSGQRHTRPVIEKSNSNTGIATGQLGKADDTLPLTQKPNGQEAQVSDRRRSIPTLTESSLDNFRPAESKQRSPSTIDQQAPSLEDKALSPRAASEQGNATSKPPRYDTRAGAPGRSFDAQRESWGSLPFRDGRTDRGRGRGGRGNQFGLSHHAPVQLQNNANVPPIQTNGPFSAKSPATFQSQYFSQSNQPPSDRRSFLSGPRSASIPNDPSYGRFGLGYAGNAPLAMFSPYLNPAYDYSAAPMSAVPYTPNIDQNMVINGVAFQLNYYFSLENLLKDVYLRKRMDSQGFVLLNFIANFQRMKDLTTDFELIKYACSQLPEFDLRHGADGQTRIRKRDGWDKWILSMDERDESAQNDGPSPAEQPKSQTPHGFEPPRSPFSDMNSHPVDGNTAVFGMTPSFQPVAVTSPIDGARSPQELLGEQPLAPLGNNILSSQYASPDIPANGVGEYGQEDDDSFPNSRIPFLTVAVRPFASVNARRISRADASRTFSNGSISMEELKQSENAPTRSHSQPDEPAEGDQLQKALNSRKPQQSSPSPTPNETATEPVELFWFKGQEALQPLPSNGNTELYVQLHYKALDDRQHAEPGSCPHDLEILYQFWSHFLIRNFNTTMYNEFRQLAHDDATQGLSNKGMRCLITFYSEALSSQQPIRDRVARHYVSLVKNEDASKGRPAFEQLRSAWRNGALNMKNRKRLSTYVDQELRDELDKADR